MAPSTAPRYSVNTYSTPHNSIFEDIEQIARTGATGIGLWEAKIPEGREEEVREALAAAGLKATFCVPAMNTLLPNTLSKPGDERDPARRAERAIAGVQRLAAFAPEAILIGPGTSGDPQKPAGPVEAIAGPLADVADAAAALGQRIGFELMAERIGSPLPTLPLIIAFLDEIARDNVGVMFDVYHSWNEPDLGRHLREHIDRIVGFHVNDIKLDERGPTDREMPGRGRDVAAGVMALLLEAGYDGWWELELLSDDGTFRFDVPNSYWKLPHEQMLREAKAAFDATYARAVEMAARQGAS